MNKLDKPYIKLLKEITDNHLEMSTDLLKDILENGTKKVQMGI